MRNWMGSWPALWRALLSVVIGAIALPAGPGLAAEADEDLLPSAESVIEKSIEVMGGREAFAKIKNRVSYGTLEIPLLKVKGPITVYEAPPSKTYSLAEIEGLGKIESGSDGTVCWESSTMAGPRLLEGEEKAVAERLNAFNRATEWKKYYKSAETKGIETIDGRLHYKIVLTPNAGLPETIFYDRRTFLPTKIELTLRGPRGEIPMEVFSFDFKKVDDILLPHKQVTRAAEVEQIVILNTIKHDQDFPADRFALPEAIKALAERAKTTAPATAPAAAPGKP
ncbi:MAG: hypothetical protein IPM13_06320 [Phycisphaerales bacterium]|nr:hypothetical protein [Phycisphaerales bacterium]